MYAIWLVEVLMGESEEGRTFIASTAGGKGALRAILRSG